MKRIILFVLSFGLLLLCGCGKKVVQESISISSSGTITETFTKTAEQEDLDTIRKSMEAEISDYYILTHGDTVKLADLSKENDQIVVRLEYGNYEIYNAYNERNLYAGSIHKALQVEDNTYFYNVKFFKAKKNKEIKMVDAIENTGKNVVIFEDDYLYQVEGKILYISENVELTGKKSARLKEGESGPGYIIY